MEPQDRIGLANLTKMAFEGIDLTPLRSQLLNQCLRDENTEGAFMDLSIIDQLYGNNELGLEWQAKALEKRRFYSTNRRQSGQTKLLVFAETGPMGGNTPIEFLLQNSDIEIITYYPSVDDDDEETLPDHDIAFCAAPVDSIKADKFHKKVRHLTRNSHLKTLNLPNTAITFDRDALGEVFSYVDGLRFPKTTRLLFERQQELNKLDASNEAVKSVGGYPIIIRPVGSHAGAGLSKVNSIDELTVYLANSMENEYFVSEFIDYATPNDGLFRKYRIVFVDGKAFPCHMAIADQWDLWYLNARMHESQEKRLEEEAFMEEFESNFLERHRERLQTLNLGIDLNYFGIDCAEDNHGNLVVFEAENALIVHDMDSEAVFPYKQKHMRYIFDAFADMLRRNCRSEMVIKSRLSPPN